MYHLFLTIPSIQLEGFEADDLIASYAGCLRASTTAISIVSSDEFDATD